MRAGRLPQESRRLQICATRTWNSKLQGGRRGRTAHLSVGDGAAHPQPRARAGDAHRRKMRHDRLGSGARRELRARALETTAFLVELRAEREMNVERQEENEDQSQRAHRPAEFRRGART